MSKYRLVVEFDAADDEAANEQVFGTDEHPEWGASDSLESIYSVSLEREDGSEVS